MVFGALTVQISVIRQLEIGPAEQASWITITWLTASLITIPLCLYYRQPLAVGWTIPGIVYMGSLADRFTLPEFAAANLVVGLAIIVLAVARFGSKVIYLVPMPVLMGMFGASILEYETRLVDSLVEDLRIAGPMLAAYVVGRLWRGSRVPPVGLAVVIGALAVVVSGTAAPPAISLSVPELHSPGLRFSLEAILTVSIPMIVLVLGIGNVQSLGFMIAEGYRPPLNVTTALIGAATVVNAVFGGHAASMARTVTAIVAGREAGPLQTRYWAAFVAFAAALGVALATGLIVALIAVLPRAYVFAMAGLALLPAFQDAMSRAFGASLRLGAVVAFVVTMTTFTVAGIPAAFWALIAGILASLLLERDELRRYWSGAAGEPAH
jgi:benzoate membrane transport protein